MASDEEPASHQSVVIRALVGALSDSSDAVREAATISLCKDARGAHVILDCCLTSLRTVKRRGGQVAVHRSSVLNVMARTIRDMERMQLSEDKIKSMVKISFTEMTSCKDLDSSWEHAASSLLVAVCCQMPSLVMEEIFLQLVGGSVPVLALVQALAEFSTIDAVQFVPHMKGVLSRVLPLLGGIKDAQKKTFADAFACWSAGMIVYVEKYPSAPYLGPDMQALLHSAFDLFLGRWLLARDAKVSLATVEALAQMFPLINKIQLKSALPKLVPSILSVYKKDSSNCFPVTHALHMLLEVVLPSGQPMLEFQAVVSILNTILPMASIYSRKERNGEASAILKNFNEVATCFVIIGTAFPEDLFNYLLSQRLNAKEMEASLGVFLILKHLLPRLATSWNGKRSTLLEAVKVSLQEPNLNLRKALAELVAIMSAVGFLQQDNDRIFLEFLVKQSAITDSEVKILHSQQEALEIALGTRNAEIHQNHLRLKVGFVSPSELRVVSDKILYLLASTTPHMEELMWPFLLKVLIPPCFTGAIATLCKCICEIIKRKNGKGEPVSVDYRLQPDVPRPEEVLGRLIVLLQNPHARNHLAASILTALLNMSSLFPTAVQLLWEDEIPKLKAYISDSEDDSWQQETWEEMILHLLSESVDVISSSEWTMSMANALSGHYCLYEGDNQHCAFLHRCLGVVLSKVDNRSFVREKIATMYRQSNVADTANRLGLAMGMGLVAASHLDTVLEKLKDVLEKESRRTITRFLASFFAQRENDVDNIYAALALMYGYAASYAPSTVIEARIDKLVGTNVLSRLLDVKSAAAKQAVITAINLLGQAVIKAGAHGVPFPLKRRDTMLDYVMTLMVSQTSSYVLATQSLLEADSLRTQNLAINACTTLVSVEPKLTSASRDRILEATLRFYTLPAEPAPVVDSVLSDLTNLLCVILRTSGEDGKSRADQVHHLLNSLDQYISSQVDHHRERACMSVLALLREFRTFCTAGCSHLFLSLCLLYKVVSGTPLLPSRDALILGKRVMMYLPRCADVSSLIRKSSAQIIDLLFSIALTLPKLGGSSSMESRQVSFGALSSLEELIAVSKWDSTAELAGTLQQIVGAVSILLTNDEYVSALQYCNTAICDIIPQCGEGATFAVKQLILERGNQLGERDIPTITQSLFKAATSVAEVGRRQKVLETVCSLAQETQSRIVMSELLAAAVREAQVKDSLKQKGSWPIDEAFKAFANHVDLALPFLDYLVSVLDQTPVLKDDTDKNEQSSHAPHIIDYFPIAAVRALTTAFRVGGDPIRKALEQRYATVFCALLLQIGGSHGTTGLDKQASRDIILAFKTFCRFVGDLDMENVVDSSIDELLTEGYWIKAVGKIAHCVALTHPKKVGAICNLLWPVLKRDYVFQRIAAAAALSEYVKTSRGTADVLEQLVGVLSRHIGDESPVVRRLCVEGLVQVPHDDMAQYAPQVLGVIVTLIDDDVESVSYAAVQGLPLVLEITTEETVVPVLLNLCVRLRSLQTRESVHMRAASFGALGTLSAFATGSQLDAFLEQMHSILPRVLLHINDEDSSVRQACKTTFKRIAPLLQAEELKHVARLDCKESDNRLYYDAFLKEITRHLITRFSDRLDTYLSCAIQAFDSPWPRVQANAVSFVAFMLSQLEDQRSSSIYVPQVVTLLMRAVENSPSQIVRARSAWALGVLLEQLKLSSSFSGDVLAGCT
ncbi:protein SHOOT GRAVITROPISM 6 isoform X4 [Selaginella moellendorffii]|uniref:protein SHOOT GRAVITROPISM 6 isoform X4 n=1 Tax=Selaginella moellendorffii TaxID=88036 RepID=UPI000D1C82AC|nr:protein SHOOT GRAVITROPISM 6 isoform X4 [Selaginella moellendorffii]|eukprot:XP_024532467.1 protein SHOOT GRAVITROPISM 6 isoform X4 [Selaginella moellendorffii]